jgi:predicted TIM-barrel fold metal-dependent hydrolase
LGSGACASLLDCRHQRSQVATERFLAAAARMKSRNWHIQLNTTLPVIAMKDALAASPVTLVFDHYGNAKEELGVGQPGFSDLVNS